MTVKKILTYLYSIFLLIPFVLGVFAGYHDLELSDLFDFSKVMDSLFLLWGLRLGFMVFLFVTLYFLNGSRRNYQVFQKHPDDDDLADQSYKKAFSYLDYGTVSYNILSVVMVLAVAIGLSQKSSLSEAWLDIIMLAILLFLQSYCLKTTQFLRDYHFSAFPTEKEMMAYVYSLDEGERQITFEQSFTIYHQLNQVILPIAYMIILFIVVTTGQLPFLALSFVVFVHIYINLVMLKATRRYYK